MILVIVAANAAALVHAPKAHAVSATQFSSRAIRLSDSTPDGSGASYLVTFQPGVSYQVKGIIVEFCSNSPTVGATCTTPSGFTVGTTPSVSTAPSTTGESFTQLGNGTGTWTSANLNTGRTLKMTNANGPSLTSGTTYAFAVSSVHNPTANGTFYARIITYTSASGDIATYAPGSEGSTDIKEAAGLALSTNYNVKITARVPEQLQFCVSGGSANIPNGCGTVTSPALTLGHVPGDPGAIVDATAVDTVTAYTQTSTNASSGVTIRMRNLNTCTTGAGGLQRTGATVCDIPAVNSGGATAAAIVAGTAAFGMLVVNVASGFTAPAPYAGPTNYGMDATTASQNVTSTYGSTILTSTGPSANSNNNLKFAATASATTPAGEYTATIILICTGQF